MISFNVNGQKLIPAGDIFMASGTLNYPELTFSFDDDWIGFSKVATFKTSNSDIYYISISDNRCIIPSEVMIDNEMITIGVYGTKGNVRITTNVINILCHRSGYGKGIAPSEQSVDLITQIQQEMLEMQQNYLTKEQFLNQLREFTVQVFGASCRINYSGTWLKQLNGFRISKSDYDPDNGDVVVIWVNNEILTPGSDYTMLQNEDYWEIANSKLTEGMYLTVQIWNVPECSGTAAGQAILLATGTSDSIAGIATAAETEEV